MQLKVEKAKQDVESVIIDTKGAILDFKKEVQDLLMVNEFNYEAYADAQENLEAYEKGLAKAELFLKERF